MTNPRSKERLRGASGNKGGFSALPSFVHSLLFDWAYFWKLSILLLLADFVLTSLIVYRVPYTEIDWRAYMQEVQGFIFGERDYTKLRGDTGPLVYPAGFVYLYSVLYASTWTHEEGFGADIAFAQYLFVGVYLATLASVLWLYYLTRPCPPWVAILLCASRRIHSIFVLRLFNDCFAMLLLYLALCIFCTNHKRKWLLGCIVYSLSVSIKMNTLLFSLPLFLLLLRNTGVVGTIKNIAVCAIVQVFLGLPFLLAYPVSYISRAFEFSRVFTYKWTVNWKFLSEEAFTSKQMAVTLLACHLAVFAFFALRWHGFRPLSVVSKLRDDPPLYIAGTMLIGNAIGVFFARTLHYQFYVWYFHALPFLLWRTRLPIILRLGVLVGIEFAFNVFPATALSSGVLQACHALLLLSLVFIPLPLIPDAGKTHKA